MTATTPAAAGGPPDLEWHVLSMEERQRFRRDWGDCTDKEAREFWKVLSAADRWQLKCAQSGRDDSLDRELQRLSDNADPETAAAFDGLLPGEVDPEFRPHLTFVRGEDIEIDHPTWLWSRWLVRGALHLLIGRQGMGKSTVAAWLVANVTTGSQLPGDDASIEPARCAMLSLEEPKSRLAARLRAAGADMSQVIVLGDVADRSGEDGLFHRPWRMPMDCAHLEAVIVRERLDLVTVDGLGYSVTGDSHNYAVVASALTALVKVAERTGATILGLTHPPKGGSQAVTAAIGSTAWTAVPRITWVLGSDARSEDEECPAISVAKTAYQRPDSAYEFSISNCEEWECGYVSGMTASDVTADELTAPAVTVGERSERLDARELLREVLGDGPVPTAEVLKAMREAGFSESTVKRARGDLKIGSTPSKDPNTGRTTGWTLSLSQGVKATGSLVGDPLDPVDLTRENGGLSAPGGQPQESGPLDRTQAPAMAVNAATTAQTDIWVTS